MHITVISRAFWKRLSALHTANLNSTTVWQNHVPISFFWWPKLLGPPWVNRDDNLIIEQRFSNPVFTTAEISRLFEGGGNYRSVQRKNLKTRFPAFFQICFLILIWVREWGGIKVSFQSFPIFYQRKSDRTLWSNGFLKDGLLWPIPGLTGSFPDYFWAGSFWSDCFWTGSFFVLRFFLESILQNLCRMKGTGKPGKDGRENNGDHHCRWIKGPADQKASQF